MPTKPEPTAIGRADAHAGLLIARFMLILGVVGLAAGFAAIHALPPEGFELSLYLIVTWACGIGLLLTTWRYELIRRSLAMALLNRTTKFVR